MLTADILVYVRGASMKKGKVTICGVPHTIDIVDDNFKNNDLLGQIEYAPAIIKLNGAMSDEMFNITCIHEVVHGMLTHLGYNQLSDDEVFVSSLAYAIDGTFKFKEEMPWEKTEVSNSKELLETALNEPSSV